MSNRELEMTRKLTLDTAKEFVTLDRNKDNGDPEDNFKHIADEWNVWLNARFPGRGIVLTTVDVAIMSMKIKVARLIGNDEKWDNYIDIAGYAACGAECAAVLKYERSQQEQETHSNVTINITGPKDHEKEDAVLNYVSSLVEQMTDDI